MMQVQSNQPFLRSALAFFCLAVWGSLAHAAEFSDAGVPLQYQRTFVGIRTFFITEDDGQESVFSTEPLALKLESDESGRLIRQYLTAPPTLGPSDVRKELKLQDDAGSYSIRFLNPDDHVAFNIQGVVRIHEQNSSSQLYLPMVSKNLKWNWSFDVESEGERFNLSGVGSYSPNGVRMDATLSNTENNRLLRYSDVYWPVEVEVYEKVRSEILSGREPALSPP